MRSVDPSQCRLVKEFKHGAPMLSCRFDPTGEYVYAGARERFVYCIEIATGKKTRLEGPESWVCAMSVRHAGTHRTPEQRSRQGSPRDPDSVDRCLFTADYGGRVICWELEHDSAVARWMIQAHRGTARSVSVSPDGQLLATGGKDGKVRLWSTETGNLIRELGAHDGQVYATVFHPDGKYLVSGDRGKNKLKQWDLETGSEVRELDAGEVSAYRRGENIEWGGVRALAFTSDVKQLACSGRNRYAGPASILLFDWETGQRTRIWRSTLKGRFHSVLAHADGFLVAGGAGQTTGELSFWKPGQDDPLATIPIPGPALAIDLDPEGHQIAVAQSLGKSVYPDSGALGIYDMSPPSDQIAAPHGDVRR